MKLFRHTSMDLFTPERARELKAFSKQAGEYADEEGNGADYLVDMFAEDKMLWEDFLETPSVKAHNPLIDTQGNLDVLSACFREGFNLSDAWDNVSWCDDEKLLRDFSRSGLHGLHFRLAINEQKNIRINATVGFASSLYRIDPSRFRYVISTLQGLSSLFDRYQSKTNTRALQGYRDDDANNQLREYPGSTEHARILVSGQDVADPVEFRAALQGFMFDGADPSTEMTRRLLVSKVESAFVPLVYNYGYGLKNEGVSIEDIREKASAHIDSILGFVELSPAFHSALKRQVLINLFSPFPEGLALMNATPGELQGVLNDPALLDNDDARAFQLTLSGPLGVFGASSSVPHAHRRTQIVEYFKGSPYALNFEVAIHGLLGRTDAIVPLFIDSSEGHSTFMDETLSGLRPKVFVDQDLLWHLMHRDRVKLYSDAAVLALVTHSINFVQNNQRFTVRVFFDQGERSLDLTFKGRPHLRDEVLQLLVDHQLLTKDMFEWLGFGQRELKKLGKHASNELKQLVLQDALGL